MKQRLSYEDSFRFLQASGFEGPGDIPPICDHIPQYDDEILCLSFFRTGIEDALLENLTIPRTYFGRSHIDRTSFANTDFTESVANWNDFNIVDFTEADLTRVDFRGCCIARTRFTRANLTDADLRCCTIKDCYFLDANMERTKMTRKTGKALNLSLAQRAQIEWHDDDGEEPDGG